MECTDSESMADDPVKNAASSFAMATPMFAPNAALTAALYGALAPKLEELDMHELYYGLELPLCPVLAEMERAGMLVDRRALADFGILLDGRIQADEAGGGGVQHQLHPAVRPHPV